VINGGFNSVNNGVASRRGSVGARSNYLKQLELGSTITTPTTLSAKNVWTARNMPQTPDADMSAHLRRNPVSYSIETAKSEVEVRVLPQNFDQESLLRTWTETSDEAFYVVDLGCVRQQVAQWRRLLPRVAPFYAVKCNPNPVIIKLLADQGVNFDCASQVEIELVLSQGVTPDRIIFANPCKFPAHIKAAHRMGVNLMTFDNEDELIKIAKCNPDAQVVMRIATDDSKAMCRFSTKFGVQNKDFESLIAKCVELRLDLVGVSFHVGSGSSDDTVYPNTLAVVRDVFDLAASYGIKMSLVDIGGGFPGVDEWNPNFPQLAAGIRPALDRLFPNTVRIIGEPGRYMVARSHTLVVNVTSRRLPDKDSGDNVLYYVDDGVYGSFSCMPFDHQRPQPQLLMSEDRECGNETRKSTIFGPTCDSLDCIGKEFQLPILEIGDWLYFNVMGAYTSASTTDFNGFKTKTFHYVDSDPLACQIQMEEAASSSDSDSGLSSGETSDSD
jgi:ornithine decarboxylase